jgi:hypothetical protein
LLANVKHAWGGHREWPRWKEDAQSQELGHGGAVEATRISDGRVCIESRLGVSQSQLLIIWVREGVSGQLWFGGKGKAG